jgi:DNA-directed RNA polymerase subunit RPC12/RpoP
MARCAYCKESETELYEGGTPICLACSSKLITKRKPPVVDPSIHRALRAELAEATAEALEATEAFSRVTTEIPSGLPHPDGARRIHNVSRQLSHARERMTLAHKRLTDYLNTGIVPEDPKRSG